MLLELYDELMDTIIRYIIDRLLFRYQKNSFAANALKSNLKRNKENIKNLLKRFKNLEDEALIEKEEKVIVRDHFIHQIRVFLIGLVMLLACENIFRYIIDSIKLILLNIDISINVDEEDIIFSWMMCSLFHDIDYMICFMLEKVIRTKNMSMHNNTVTGLLDYLSPQSTEAKNIVNILKKSISNSSRNRDELIKLAKDLITSIRDEVLEYIENININRNVIRSYRECHGVFSAHIMLNFLSTVTSYCKKYIDIISERVSKKVRVLFELIIISILVHNADGLIHLTSLSQLLALCDEVQEWCRLIKFGGIPFPIVVCEYVKLILRREPSGIIVMDVFIVYGDLPKLDRELIEKNIKLRLSIIDKKFKVYREIVRDPTNLVMKILFVIRCRDLEDKVEVNIPYVR
ncbi:MAG: hypothetical protein GXO10_05665 [Crenarchaeota archaeon]|nr:hypothetical protein [Thermoproteota archaeon]